MRSGASGSGLDRHSPAALEAHGHHLVNSGCGALPIPQRSGFVSTCQRAVSGCHRDVTRCHESVTRASQHVTRVSPICHRCVTRCHKSVTKCHRPRRQFSGKSAISVLKTKIFPGKQAHVTQGPSGRQLPRECHIECHTIVTRLLRRVSGVSQDVTDVTECHKSVTKVSLRCHEMSRDVTTASPRVTEVSRLHRPVNAKTL